MNKNKDYLVTQFSQNNVPQMETYINEKSNAGYLLHSLVPFQRTPESLWWMVTMEVEADNCDGCCRE